MKYKTIALALLALCLSNPAAAQVRWMVAPYVWLSDVSLEESGGASGEISAQDLLDKSDAVGMIRVEAAGSKWGVMADYLWLSTSDSMRFDLPIIGPLDLNTSLDVSVLELGGSYRTGADDYGLHLLFGARNIDADATLILVPAIGPPERFDGGESYTDGFLGARYLGRLGENWNVTVRGDYGFGDTEGSLNLIGTVGYRFNNTFGLNLGYRHFTAELEDRDGSDIVQTDITMSGPLLGFVFTF